LCAYDFFAGPLVRRLGGRSIGWPYRRVSLPLARKLTSVVGRVDYTRVRIRSGQVEPLSTSGASILSSVSRADGFVVIPTDREGYPAGAQVVVWCYDESTVDGSHAGEDPRESARRFDQSIAAPDAARVILRIGRPRLQLFPTRHRPASSLVRKPLIRQ
jgi:hypothetical protein